MESLAPTILVLLEHMKIITYLHVASLTLWVFEQFITLDKEVIYIWKSPHWSIVKVLYVFVRYSTYVDASLNIVGQLFGFSGLSNSMIQIYLGRVSRNRHDSCRNHPNPARLGGLAKIKDDNHYISYMFRWHLGTSVGERWNSWEISNIANELTVKCGGKSTFVNVVIRDVSIAEVNTQGILTRTLASGFIGEYGGSVKTQYLVVLSIRHSPAVLS
ncbi:hypothetical protein BDQ17DRAFT_1328148 [Cyathus striatus]|nr:hypothetical protein BDQ17DRAFT_1328148 [Cyathus striatus]